MLAPVPGLGAVPIISNENRARRGAGWSRHRDVIFPPRNRAAVCGNEPVTLMGPNSALRFRWRHFSQATDPNAVQQARDEGENQLGTQAFVAAQGCP